MLTMTYSPADEAMADRIKEDLSTMPLKLEHRLLLVLATPDSLNDDSVTRAIKQAEKEGTRIALVRLKPVVTPPNMGEFAPLDMSATYDIKRLARYLNRVDMGAVRLRRGRQLLFFISSAAILMFMLAIWGIVTRQVAFPVDEYATEYAVEINQIETFAAPTLEFVMPRTTADALNYASTVEKIPTRVREYAIETATALSMAQFSFATAAAATSIALTQPAPAATP